MFAAFKANDSKSEFLDIFQNQINKNYFCIYLDKNYILKFQYCLHKKLSFRTEIGNSAVNRKSLFLINLLPFHKLTPCIIKFNGCRFHFLVIICP